MLTDPDLSFNKSSTTTPYISQYTDIQYWWSLMQPQTHHGEVGVVCGEAQAQLGLHLWSHPLQHAVKHVVVPLIWSLDEMQKKPTFIFNF